MSSPRKPDSRPIDLSDMEHGDPPDPPKRQKWEYDFLHDPCRSAMDIRGEAGWELVSVTFDTNDGRSTAWFKRRKQ